MKTAEEMWNHFDQVLARRERGRLIKLGRIKTRTKPNVLVRNEAGKFVFPSIV